LPKIWIIVLGVVIAAAAAAAAWFWLMTPGTRPMPVAGVPSQSAGSVEIKPTDRILGNRDAPVTIVEYASLTCPHCAHFETAILPELKRDYIDTGKVRLVYRDFPLDQLALVAAGVARCAPPERYFGLLSMLFEGQESWARSPDPVAALVRFGKLAGLSEEKVRSCIEDTALLDQIVAERLEGERMFGISSTPSFVIDGRKYSGALDAAQFRAVLDPLVN